MVPILGIIAGLLQALGYVLYILKSLKHEVEPNPTTWLMFAYGTALLTMLEFNRGADFSTLLLPIVCTTLGIVVAGICWQHGTLKWPSNKADRLAFVADLFLTACYIGAWILQKHQVLSESQKDLAVLVFLMASNLTIFTSFGPLLRETRKRPESERYEPWLAWSLAYTVLGVATYLQVGLWNELILYPLISAPLHGLVAWFSRPMK